MNYLLDTNVISELVKPYPQSTVVAWLADVDEDRVFISVVTLAELRHGVELLPVSKRQDRLNAWLGHELPARFEKRILNVDAAIADAWGVLTARRQTGGKPASAMDMLIAATAQVHQLTLVTRNTSDFKGVVERILNPY
ncbi:MAG TPA: type II toxin-antitoxin system VapC family toxin [Phycisphaerae bacterium]|nr:type II toxin-antitoxin system VapC family toxin [Phycisphaerae bacterium]